MKNKMMVAALFILMQCKETVEEVGECMTLTAFPLSYSIHVYPIINKTCAIPECHVRDSEFGDFNRFEEVQKRVRNGKLKFMIETHQMPHGFTKGPLYLTSCEIETMKKWIREGANNN